MTQSRYQTRWTNNNQQGPAPAQTQAQAQNTYQNRYRRDGGLVLDRIYSAGPYIIAIVSFAIAVAALVSLLAVDIITGKYTAEHMTSSDFGWFSSLATTGLVMALMGTVMYGFRERWSVWVMAPLILVAIVPVSIDVYFDSMSVDIIKFGHFIVASQALDPAEVIPHYLFRIMIGALSAIGEPLAATSVIIFPVLKELFKGVFS